MLRTGGGDRQSLRSRLGKYTACCGSTGTGTYPAMVLRVSFQEQSLERDYAREEGELGLCNGIRSGRLESDVRLCTQNMGLHKLSLALVISQVK